jgi:phage I-like protein
VEGSREWSTLNTKISVDYNQSCVLTAQKTHSVSIIQAIQLVLYKEVTGVYSEIHKKANKHGGARG